MTKKKELKWRLSDLPNGSEVAKLVEQGVITKDEARDILFNEEEKDLEKKALKEQVKFLEGVIDRLTKNRNAWTWTFTPSIPVTYWNGWNVRPVYQQLGVYTSGTSSLNNVQGSISSGNPTISSGTAAINVSSSNLLK